MIRRSLGWLYPGALAAALAVAELHARFAGGVGMAREKDVGEVRPDETGAAGDQT